MSSNYCKHCNTQTTNPKFCSKSCSASFNNKNRKRTEESKQKTSLKIKELIRLGKMPTNKGKELLERIVKRSLSYCFK
jgi:transposase-like protein